MQFRVLGPVQFSVGDKVLDVGPPQRCLVFAALVTDAGRLVLQETLIDRVWRQPPPQGARRTVQTHIANIRGLLRKAGATGHTPPALVRRRGGYVLDIDPDLVDVHRFRRLAAQAANADVATVERLALWREAVGLWRGAPLAALAGDWAARTRDAWHAEHRDAVLGWAYAEIEAGNPTVVISPLADLIDQYPLVETLPAMLMRALYAVGRRTDALDCYTAAQRRLDDELAEEPGAELTAVYQAILRRDADVPPPLGTAPAGVAVPAQLPPDVRGFAGRTDQLAQLDALAATVGGGATAVVISAIAGTAGAGKTALAVHWAHRNAKRFPDGQLYVDLRGFDPGGAAVDPTDAVRGFLDAVAMPPERIPTERSAQTALYRTVLADKRMLVVLDNARDSEQVRPLLPGAPGCLVLITSRNPLTSLVTATGAHPLPLDLLTPQEARELLTRRLGARRVATESDAVDALVTGCARLPLALAIVAARAATHPHFSLAALAAELHDARTRLDALADTDPTTDVRAVFSWSYVTLTPPAARLFRLLGLHPGPDIPATAAASLTGLPPSRLRPLLAELTHAHLIAEHRPGRYAFHDLLRAYATDLAQVHDSDPERRAALTRVLDHYTHTAHNADRLLRPHRDSGSIPLTPPSSGTYPQQFADHQQAMAWFSVERPVLLAVLRHAADAGLDASTCQLAWALDTFLDRQGHWSDLTAVWQAALHAARRLRDPSAQAFTHRFLAGGLSRLGRHADGHTHLQHALELYRQVGDRYGQAQIHQNLGSLWDRQGDYRKAVDHAQQSLDLYRAVGHRRGHADALNAVGWCHAQLGDHRQALLHCEQALDLLQQLGDRAGEAATWDSIGFAHHQLGNHTQAIECYRRALVLSRELGARYDEADILHQLGNIGDATGDLAAAEAAWREALAILDDLNHPDTDQLRAKLHRSPGQPARRAATT
ncbi:tetratricopeptide repeat protein [Dactylosporangium roseum]|uniref:Tetratricopeptide repeat protein n=1 Tax=Dactylosporangium roseum TaxID=47989 RepID=A0ABY5ZBG9_9ACTN|nr:tetratricopeptide repeat protein [Dactylosporangium roseum]UWZ39456.1 tetratricopeptide repeat protein [Dactylosporangium roseum]